MVCTSMYYYDTGFIQTQKFPSLFTILKRDVTHKILCVLESTAHVDILIACGATVLNLFTETSISLIRSITGAISIQYMVV